MNRTRRPLALRGAVLAVLIGLPIAGGAVGIRPQTLHYQVDYNGINAGQLDVDIARQGRLYTVTSTSRLSVFTALLLKNYRNQTTFEQHGSGVRLTGGSELLVNKRQPEKSQEQRFRVDFDQRQIRFDDHPPVSITPQQTLAAAAFPLVLMHTPIEQVDALNVLAVSTRWAREYVHTPPEKHRLPLADEMQDTWKITRFRKDRPDSNTTFWLATGENPVPVKIVVAKKNQRVTLQLIP